MTPYRKSTPGMTAIGLPPGTSGASGASKYGTAIYAYPVPPITLGEAGPLPLSKPYTTSLFEII